MKRHRRHTGGAFVEPDLPITPMLDMSFQLLAYFLMTFSPTPTEGHLDVILPMQPGKADVTKIPDPLQDLQEELTVRVDGDEKGDIAGIFIVNKEGVEATLPGKGRDARKSLFNDLQKRLAAAKADYASRKSPDNPFAPPKIKLELADNLSFKLVVAVMDECGRAGFPAVAPTMKDDKK